MKEFSTFLYMGKRTGIIRTIPSICTSAIWSQYPLLSHPEAPHCHCERREEGLAAATDC